MCDIQALVEVRNATWSRPWTRRAAPCRDGRTVTVGRAEFDALLGGRRKRAWVTIRKNAPVPVLR
jgi:hypothetical protein